MIKRKGIRLNKKRLLFFIGMAYFIVIPIATFISDADRDNIVAYITVVVPSLFVYMVLSGIGYLMRHSIQKIVEDYDLVRRIKSIPEWLYRNRWPIGLVLWMVLAFFQIHGSSIGVYANMLNVPELDTAVIGFSRPDRFDEWLNMTSFAFSQYIPGTDGPFSYFNTYIRAVPTDMFIVLGQPCWDICTIFRPFLLGYLFLPQGNGLAFFWMGRFIILALISYEFSRLWTKNNRILSWYYALMITLSPAVQWWFAVNEFVEMLIAGQAAIIVLKKYLQCQTEWQKIGLTLIFAYLTLMYTYVMYPAWQIPFVYIFFVFALYIIYQHKKIFKWSRYDILHAGILIFVVVLPVLHTMYLSADAISLIQNSEYPGHRFVMGGKLTWDWLFNSGLGLFTPFSGLTSPQYAFNLTQFFDLAPLGIVLALYKMGKERQWDFLLCAFLALDGIFMIFCLFPWPHWFVYITLLFQVPEGRMIIPISYINVVLLLRVLTLWPQPINKLVAMILAAVISAFSAWASFHYCADAYMWHNAVVLVIVMFLGVVCLCHYRRYLGVFLLGLFLCIGGMVNPIARGTSSIYDTELAQAISAITAVDKGRWIVIDSKNTTLNNYPVIFGAPTINSYNTYVAWDNWNKLELNDDARKVLNRCAHIKISEITKEPSTYNSEHGDIAEITLQREDVCRLEVRYIMADCVDLQPLDTDEIQFKPIRWANGRIIYKVIYQEE